MCRYAEYRYDECRYAQCRYDECHYTDCRYAECRGASTIYLLTLIIFTNWRKTSVFVTAIHFHPSLTFSSPSSVDGEKLFLSVFKCSFI